MFNQANYLKLFVFGPASKQSKRTKTKRLLSARLTERTTGILTITSNFQILTNFQEFDALGEIIVGKVEIAQLKQFRLPTMIYSFLQLFYTFRVSSRCNGWLSAIKL